MKLITMLFFQALSAAVCPGNTQASLFSASCAMLPNPAPFISLLNLVCLAGIVNYHCHQYMLTKYNCFWFSSLLFFALWSHTSLTVTVSCSRDKSPIIIQSGDSTEAIKRKFKQVKLDFGHYGIFVIIGLLQYEEINEILMKWDCEWRELNTKVCSCACYVAFLLLTLYLDL
jgi:hypothetical protein